VFLIAQTIHFIYVVLTFGRPYMVLMTLVFAFLVDQCKSIISLTMIYCIVVRRFMHLDVNEDEYMPPDWEKVPKQENAIPKLKIFLLKHLESWFVEMISMIIISLYTFFILFWLLHSEFGNFKVSDEKLSVIDNYFLTIFETEIILKSFSSNYMYLYDAFNMFDAIIVNVSLVLNMMGTIAKGLGVLRLIRVVVIILRKITGNQSKLRHQNKNNNPVEALIKILH